MGSCWELFKEYLSQQWEEVVEICQKVVEIGCEVISKLMECLLVVCGDVVIGIVLIVVMIIGDIIIVMIDLGVLELIIKFGQNIVIWLWEKGMVMV